MSDKLHLWTSASLGLDWVVSASYKKACAAIRHLEYQAVAVKQIPDDQLIEVCEQEGPPYKKILAVDLAARLYEGATIHEE
ncbi:MAG: hypothetical protein GY861_01220 [bacterium]|nr:hypothetical protein [bacterium]